MIKAFNRETSQMAIGYPKLAYFGHHKCGSSWINTILREVCFHAGISFAIAHRPADWTRWGTLNRFATLRRAEFLAYTNAQIKHTYDLSLARAVHVIRDPRDVLVSAYFSHLKIHRTEGWPELAEHRKRLQQLSLEDGLILEMEFSRDEFEDMYGWNYEQPNVLEVRLEELTENPVDRFIEMLSFLGLVDDKDRYLGAVRVIGRINRLREKGRRLLPYGMPALPIPRVRLGKLPKRQLEAIITYFSFEKMSGGRKRGVEDRGSHYRKGTPGDWVNYFSDRHKVIFKERFNHVLNKLGYEHGWDW